MKPNKIFDVLDVAMMIREQGGKFNPLFVGAPGVGKSEIVQQWCNNQKIPFIDLRAAYLEAPDVIGFPSIEKNEEGRQVTVHNTPEFLPGTRNVKGVLLLEEPNRGTTSVMNCFMQLLTDRKIHNYKLPEGWLIVGCINPEGTEYDVNTMDAALKNRFEIFNVVYDKPTFVDYMKNNDWHKDIVMFVESGTWQYKLPEEIGENVNAKYISPRSLSKLNSVLNVPAKLTAEDELLYFQTILGSGVGRDFYNFRHNETPVLYKELLDTPKSAFKRLEKFCDTNNLKNGMIAITIQDIVEDGTVKDEMLVKLAKVLPAEHSLALFKELEFKRKGDDIVSRLFSNYPEVKDLLKSVLKK